MTDTASRILVDRLSDLFQSLGVEMAILSVFVVYLVVDTLAVLWYAYASTYIQEDRIELGHGRY